MWHRLYNMFAETEHYYCTLDLNFVNDVKLNNYSNKVNEINFSILARQHGIYFNCVMVHVN